MSRSHAWLLFLGTVGGFALGCRSNFAETCPVGSEECPCTDGGMCDEGLICLSNTCVQDDGETGDTNATMEAGDGDSSTGDGDSTTGDGDSTTGDGDSTTGDGDSTTGDGDGDGDAMPPDVPMLRTPLQGARIGSALAPDSLRPRFSWTNVDVPVDATSVEYEIQTSTDPGLANAKGATVSGTAWQPVDGLPVSITQPVGDIYYWRVRACSDAGACSDWSAIRRYTLGRPIKDVDGDGFPDVIATEPDAFNFGGFGKVVIHRGGQGAGFDTSPDYTVDGDVEGYRYGIDAVTADVNGDGFADVVAGSFGLNDGGRLQIHLSTAMGPNSNNFIELDNDVAGNYTAYAWHVANAGDVNGDGYADIVVGEPGTNTLDTNFPGYAHVFLGAPAITTSITHIQINGISDGDYFGRAVASCDVNGDGFSDILVGAPERFGGGAAYIYTGHAMGVSNTAWATLGVPAGTAFGADIACAGDVNGDGYEDVIVGDEEALSAHLFYGAADPISGDPDHTVSGPSGSNFGRAVGTGDDMDRDGFSEFLVTAPGNTIYQGGAVLIWRGDNDLPGNQPDGQINHQNTLNGETGHSLGLARDVNGDGFIDVPTGRWDGGNGVYVFMGEGSFSYDDNPPTLTGANDYGSTIF